ncbi:hypothetical protein CYMTET_28789 [Cymbomonas tetramitiformis]|uniref:Uncharacterized protein n=1 Tax=Cymbomonas tetramitiformis TaxID=36881 RepID=A0AAE0FMU1_9CHLO|nr:hypothetical protein CYMTET_28789 [Cymbomonas tetramitiformis]
MRLTCWVLVVLLAQIPLSAAFPKYQLTYYPPITNCVDCCSGTGQNIILYSWIWDLSEPCFAFIPFNADVWDSVNNPVFTDTTIEYNYHPKVDDCSSTRDTKKYATTDGCTLQLEGESYYLKITCIQKTSSDPECVPLWTHEYLDSTDSSPSSVPPASTPAPTRADSSSSEGGTFDYAIYLDAACTQPGGQGADMPPWTFATESCNGWAGGVGDNSMKISSCSSKCICFTQFAGNRDCTETPQQNVKEACVDTCALDAQGTYLTMSSFTGCSDQFAVSDADYSCATTGMADSTDVTAPEASPSPPEPSPLPPPPVAATTIDSVGCSGGKYTVAAAGGSKGVALLRSSGSGSASVFVRSTADSCSVQTGLADTVQYKVDLTANQKDMFVKTFTLGSDCLSTYMFQSLDMATCTLSETKESVVSAPGSSNLNSVNTDYGADYGADEGDEVAAPNAPSPPPVAEADSGQGVIRAMFAIPLALFMGLCALMHA